MELYLVEERMTLGLPPGLIIGGLNLLAGHTGCDGIVNLQILNSMGGLRYRY